MGTLGDIYPSMTSLLKYDHLEGLVDFPRGMLRARLFSECDPSLPWDPSLPSQFCLLYKVPYPKFKVMSYQLFFPHVNLLHGKLCSSLCGSQAKRQPSQRFEKEGCITFSNNSENLSQSSVSPTGKSG